MALDNPAPMLGIHLSNLDVAPYTGPGSGPGSRPLSAAERAYLAQYQRWRQDDRGYGAIQSTRPQTVSYGLNDSPAGLAAWVLEKWRGWADSGRDIDAIFSRDFLLKDTQPADLVGAIRTIAAGDAVLAPGATKRLIQQFAFTQPPEQPSGHRGAQIRQALTGREQDVFSYIAAGMSNSEIAASLFLSEGTVKIHVGRILAKLGLRDRVQAVVLAYESRLITPGTLPDGPGQPD